MVVFLITYLLIAPNGIHFVPIGRPAGAMVGAALALALGIISIEEFTNAVANGLHVLILLFSLMIISAFAAKDGIFRIFTNMLFYRCNSGNWLIVRLSVVSAFLSAFLTNDAACIFLTPLVVQKILERDLPGTPFLIALATSSNIGSACTTVGNPQNAIIAYKSDLHFVEFVAHLLPASVIALTMNIFMILFFYRDLLKGIYLSVDDAGSVPAAVDTEASFSSPSSSGDGYDTLPTLADSAPVIVSGHLRIEVQNQVPDMQAMNGNDGDALQDSGGDQGLLASPAFCSTLKSTGLEINYESPNSPSPGDGKNGLEAIIPAMRLDDVMEMPLTAQEEVASSNSHTPVYHPVPNPFIPTSIYDLRLWRYRTWRDRKAVISWMMTTAGILAMAILFVVGFDIASVSFIVCTYLILMQGLLLQLDPAPFLLQVDFRLLCFFSALFVVVACVLRTGYPDTLWDFVFDRFRVDSAAGISIFTTLITMLSNTISNVPAVLIASDTIVSSEPATDMEWYLLAWVSTIAGNLTILGSAAVIITVERAQQAGMSQAVGFFTFLMYGLPSTILILLVTVPIVVFLSS